MDEEEIKNLKDPLFVNYNLLLKLDGIFLKLEEIREILASNIKSTELKIGE